MINLLLQVATESSVVGLTVVEALATPRARGGVYKVMCRAGPWAGQHSVLKHGGRPQELAQLRERRVNTVEWHQVTLRIHNKPPVVKGFSCALHCNFTHLLPHFHVRVNQVFGLRCDRTTYDQVLRDKLYANRVQGFKGWPQMS
jgi:hypothetical protein